MNEIMTTVAAVGGLALAGIGLGHAAGKGKSELGHQAAHQALLGDRRANRLVGEVIGVLAMNPPNELYRRGADGQAGHLGHHRRRRVAGAEDEETAFLLSLGFRPGTPKRVLWRRYWCTLFSPGFHLRQSAQRLGQNLFCGPAWRRGLAWLVWGGGAVAAALAGLLPALLLGAVLPLLLVGNAAMFVHLCSEHRWCVTVPAGEDRAFALSHGRFFAPAPPDEAAPASAWAAFWWHVAQSLLARVLVTRTEGPWHHAHHIGLDHDVKAAMAAQQPDLVPWADPAVAYSKAFWDDDALAAQSHTSLHDALDAWFDALSKEPAQ